MSVTFKVLPEHNLVYVHCAGSVTVAESISAFDSYRAYPDTHPGQSQLVDLSDVVEYERDFTRIMSLQAHQVDVYMEAESPVFLIYVAPNDLTRTMAMAALRSWQNLPGVIPLVLSSLDEALTVLSLDKHDLAGALEATS